MLNRANRRIAIFEKDADYEAFERVMTEAVERFQIDLFSYVEEKVSGTNGVVHGVFALSVLIFLSPAQR